MAIYKCDYYYCYYYYYCGMGKEALRFSFNSPVFPKPVKPELAKRVTMLEVFEIRVQ